MSENENTVRTKSIVVLPGDGVGPEIVAEAVKVLKAVAVKFGHDFALQTHLIGGAAIDATGRALPDETLAACQTADAVLLGAVGGPKWDALPAEQRPERAALLPLRSALGLFCNLRPAKVWAPLKEASPLRPEIVWGDEKDESENGIDMLVVRELAACDTMRDSVPEIERIARMAFKAAQGRRGRVTSVDKANVLETSRLWRETVTRLQRDEFPSIALDHLYVDNAAMQIVRAPRRFDVILTENMFGDILSDEASQITGSIGMLPSASLRGDGFGLYEPIHGSAPDIAGQGIANPIATILSVAMMLRHSFGLAAEAAAVERAVGEALAAGCRTADIARTGETSLSTAVLGDAVAAKI